MGDSSSDSVTPILIGKGSEQRFLLPGYANRHGLITGATGTGKTVTLQVLAEGFARIGVPVFLADVKGDLSGLTQPISAHPKIDERIEKIGMDDFQASAWPVIFWDVLGAKGHPVRTTISEMGPLLLANLLELNDTQEGVLNIAFRVADEEGLLLLDLEDLRALLRFVAENAKTLSQQYGHVSSSSVAAIQRRLLVLEEQGAEEFFGEPALRLSDLMRTDTTGRGMISTLASDELVRRPRLYATMLLWLLAELFEELPEVGDADKPRLVFFFDEAHLLFDRAPRALVDQVEQVVRLIRSKGVSVWFVTQNPMDVPDDVSSQLGNRVQHALRAYTPREQRAVKAAADSFRQNPDIDSIKTITELGVGEALVSMLGEGGVPAMVDRCLIRPPTSRIGPASATERESVFKASPVAGQYDEPVDRESAAELLQMRAEARAKEEAKAEEQSESKKSSSSTSMNPLMRGVVAALGAAIVRGLLGAIKKG